MLLEKQLLLNLYYLILYLLSNLEWDFINLQILIYLIKGLKVHSKTLNLYTVESNISKRLGEIQKKYKRLVDIGSYPFFRLGKIGVAIVTRSTSELQLKKVNTDLKKLAIKKNIKIFKI